jgi:RNA polymerase sigma factor (sigma-70 family)
MSDSDLTEEPREPTAHGQVNEPLPRQLSCAEREFVQHLFERHRLSLERYLTGLVYTREDAKEILQETYLRFLRQPSLDRLRDNARAYLFQIATNLARDLFRQNSQKHKLARMAFIDTQGLVAPDWTSWPEVSLQGTQVAAVIISALQDLDPEVRTALLLHRYRELTHRQIATRMGVSERTIERYVKHALAHIDQRLRANQ